MMMKKVLKRVLFGLVCACASVVAADQEGEGIPVIAETELALVTDRDMEAALQGVAEEHRIALALDMEKLKRLLESVTIAKHVALQAEAEGFLQEPGVAEQVALARDRQIAALYLERLMTRAAEEAEPAAIEQRARELYQVERDTFVEPAAVHAAHILIKDTEDDAALARQLRGRIVEGADFAQLAAEYSKDRASAAKGGDVGWFKRNGMVKPFADAAFALSEEAPLSEPVKTRFGTHLILLLERKRERQQTYEEVAPQLKERLAKDLREQARSHYLTDVFSEDKSKIYIDNLKALQEAYRAKLEIPGD